MHLDVAAKGVPAVSSMERRCVHCQAVSTPLWRRSPLGPKTLCNACGVRMKKGRLAFVDGRFVPVESAAAIAKRRKAEAAAKTARENAASSAALHQHRSSNATVNTSVTLTKVAAAAITKPAKPTRPPKVNSTSATKTASNRRSRAFNGGKSGLYYLLAAIDFVEAN